ncbi:MAG: D-tagatose,6-bisphosphate aldolase subunit GatZ/KbaZ [Candidatus Atribacteria bacterium]|nr:D-tagatose,6-bisphosphate aldolase subunit GatZ/KbaZ [Candidatus Atribacteria bacterium]
MVSYERKEIMEADQNFLQKMVHLQSKNIAQGICSICSANSYVIEAGMEKAASRGMPVLIESTSNQVNQLGGYTGMAPADFRTMVIQIAEKIAFPKEKIILGGDHLGPNPWKDKPAEVALQMGCDLVKEYVRAGFSKIHLDASMFLGDDTGDRNEPLPTSITTERTAILAKSAEEAYRGGGREKTPPVYVIGTEVPSPGGSEELRHAPAVTRMADLEETILLTKEAFARHNLGGAWERVIAVVVQPGVEFTGDKVFDYDREKFQELKVLLAKFPQLVFEGHSTDYQKAEKLKEMVEDKIAILKVGPALTFALREALFMLDLMEGELLKANKIKEQSHLVAVLEEVMLQDPKYWIRYYRGDEVTKRFALKYSLYDRCRYYWTHPRVQKALGLLLVNLRSAEIPFSLISQFFPTQAKRVRGEILAADPVVLIKDWIGQVLDDYYYATEQ